MEDYNSKYSGEEVDGLLDEIGNKVDKVEGKQLSTEDFTTILKQKLDGLSNYDDTTISQAVDKLRKDLDALVSGDTTTAIKTFNEVIAFLDGISDTEDLSGIIASIEQQIAGKMDSVTLAKVATSGSYDDLSNKPAIPAEQVNADWNATSGKAQILNKPTIPSAVTESTVSGWGFTKNTGTYSKPSTGIPKTDLASAVQTSLGKADSALQEIPSDVVRSSNMKTINGESILGSGNIEISGGGSGTITGVSANGTSIATSGVANIPAASTSAYGVTKLTTATNSTSTTLAATASAVKSAYDLANSYKGTVTAVKVNGSSKSPSSGTVDIGNVVTSVKVNGSTYSPSSGVVDLGTISGGGSSSNGDDNRYFANFTVEEFIEAVKNYSDITDDTEDLLAALNAGKILCIPYQDVDSGYVIATYKYTDGDYTYIEITVDASTYLAYIDNSYYTLSGLSAFLIATNISYIGDTEVEIDCVDNTIYIAQKPLSDLAVYASNDAPIGVSIRFVPAEGFTLHLPSNALWVNGVVPTIESGVMYELFIATTTKILAGLVPFKSV